MDVGKIEQLTNHGEGKVAPKGAIMPLIENKKYPLGDPLRTMIVGPEAKQADQKIPPEVLRHDWAYAIAPVRDAIYLTGYCKNCQTALTALLRTDPDDGPEFIRISKLDIPLYGCEYKRH